MYRVSQKRQYSEPVVKLVTQKAVNKQIQKQFRVRKCCPVYQLLELTKEVTKFSRFQLCFNIMKHLPDGFKII